jgi:dodecin
MEDTMAESVYKVIELIGTSPDSWEKAAKAAVERAGQSLRDLRVAEVVEQDLVIENGKVTAYRSKMKVSFKYEDGKDRGSAASLSLPVAEKLLTLPCSAPGKSGSLQRSPPVPTRRDDRGKHYCATRGRRDGRAGTIPNLRETPSLLIEQWAEPRSSRGSFRVCKGIDC